MVKPRGYSGWDVAVRLNLAIQIQNDGQRFGGAIIREQVVFEILNKRCSWVSCEKSGICCENGHHKK